MLFIFSMSLIQTAAEWAAFGCFWTNGQICSATSRLIVHVSMIELLHVYTHIRLSIQDLSLSLSYTHTHFLAPLFYCISFLSCMKKSTVLESSTHLWYGM